MSSRQWSAVALAAFAAGSLLAPIDGLAAGSIVSGEPTLWHFLVDHGAWMPG